jgi:hypothetical protein
MNSIIQEEEKNSVCHHLMAPDIDWYDLYILSPIQQGFYGTSSICYQYYIHKITKPLLSSPNKPVGC